MKSLALRVLSDFGVDGLEPGALGSRKGRLALCVLALAGGQVVPADVLVDTLWGDAPPARPEDQLAVLVSRLRSVLGRERIQHRDRGYVLVCDWLDAGSPRGIRRRRGLVVDGEAAADFAVPAWLDLAAGRAGRLARQAGDHADTLRRAAGRRLDGWRARGGR